MSTVNESMQGYPPKVVITKRNPEALKYHRLYAMETYRKNSPGELFAQVFLDKAKPRMGASIIDCGSGTGRAGVIFATLGKMKVTMIDFVDNCLDEKVKAMIEARRGSGEHDGFSRQDDLKFIKADLEESLLVIAEYAFCSDTMEHVPPSKVDKVLNNILLAAQKCWFSIALFDETMGPELIGEPLHLTIRTFEWWEQKFKDREAEIIYSHNQDNIYAHFLVNAWPNASKIVEHGSLNTEEQVILENVRHNTRSVWMLQKENGEELGPYETEDLALSNKIGGYQPKAYRRWQQVSPHEENDFECMILGGGPSLNDYVDEIKKNRADGVKLLTLNGAYNWAVHHGIMPSAQIVVDAREFNQRFVDPVVDGCKYLIASQCHPSLLENLPKERTFLWHTMAEQIQDILDTRYGQGQYWPIPGGSTVLLRAIPLMRMLGYHKFILYGCDSCLINDHHHAYTQIENDASPIVPVIVNPGGRIFMCNPWQASQAQEFIDTVKYIGDEIDLDVKGDGLLAYILKVGAEEAEIHEAT